MRKRKRKKSMYWLNENVTDYIIGAGMVALIYDAMCFVEWIANL